MTAESEGRVRLTKAQRSTLSYLREGPSVRLPCPKQAGMALSGLITFTAPSRLKPFGAWEITPAGRRALETSHDK